MPTASCPCTASRPPSQYTAAVPTAPTSDSAAKRYRLSRASRIPESRTAPARPENSLRLGVRPAEQLDEQGAGHVEPLGHVGAHVGVELHLVAGQAADAPGHDPVQDDERRQDEQGQRR